MYTYADYSTYFTSGANVKVINTCEHFPLTKKKTLDMILHCAVMTAGKQLYLLLAEQFPEAIRLVDFYNVLED